MTDFEAIDALLAAARQEAQLPPAGRRRLLREALSLSRTQVAQALGVSPSTVGGVTAWLEGKRSPSRKNLERIESAYRTVRRHNVARYLLGRLNADGRGTRVEIHPLNQSQVPRPRQRVVEYRTLNVRHWDALVQAWAADDARALDEAWVEQIVDLGSQWGQYEYVTNVGFAA
ncbi:helix-turn-helix transcriptional regulator [Streptomyces sp. NPDC048309]|uniref:helix-turn-helix domain-containing protein n=1 Tax=unclassified Streptomyces TaxID=2593676 RepID=UPI0033F9CC7D